MKGLPLSLFFVSWTSHQILVCWGNESPVQMVCCRSVSGILRKAGVILVPLSENKKSLGMPDLGFLRVTWPATTSHPWLDAALFCHPWQNITVCRQADQDFLIFSQSHKISFGFAQDASLQVMNTIGAGGSSQNWGSRCEFLIFARMEICLKF